MAISDTEKFERQNAVNNANAESEISDYKQHASKMLRDFEKFNDFSSNRAIWELVQNACDLTINCDIVIDYRYNKFSFCHNGKPFTTNAFVSLIKQVSGDKDGEHEIQSVGKYGTGFLTTHSLGRKFTINSVLATQGKYILIKDFLIDRSATEWQKLSSDIRDQKNKLLDILANREEITNPKFETTFTYFPESEQEIKYIKNSFIDIEDYVPIVITINDRLKSFKIISKENTETIFQLEKKEQIPNDHGINLYKATILKNGIEQIIYSLKDNESEIEIILPITKHHTLIQFSERIARLFLYYPLVGSEKFGINFIINSTKFQPTEPRDGIHLRSNKDQVRQQEEINKAIILKASNLIFSFLKSNILPVSNPLLYSEINFIRNSGNIMLDEYFTALQTKWVSEFIQLPIVLTEDGYKKIPEIVLLSPKMLMSEDYFDCIYYILRKFFLNIPSKESIKDWSHFISKWDFKQVIFIDHEKLSQKLNSQELFNFDIGKLNAFYKFLIEEKHEQLFTTYSLLPNILGKFQSLTVLKKGKNIDSSFIEIGKKLIPKEISFLINEEFAFQFQFLSYTRKDFSNSVNLLLNEKSIDKFYYLPPNHKENITLTSIVNVSRVLDSGTFESILNFCRLNHNKESQSKPSKLIRLICNYYNLPAELISVEQIELIEEDFDIRQAQKKLVKVFFNSLLNLDNNSIKENFNLFYDILNYYEDRFKEVYNDSKIYPNQLYELCLQINLKKDNDLVSDIKELYNRITNKNIESTLLHKGLNQFLIENEIVTNKLLSTNIEDAFFDVDIFHINDHKFKDDVLNIIKKMNNDFYRDLFPRLYDKRANIMLQVVTNDSIKDDIFSIVTLKDDQLKKLGELIKSGNLDEILQKAKDFIKIEEEKQSDFQHKHTIGVYIEKIIREKIENGIRSGIHITNQDNPSVLDEQKGQDIIIYYKEIPVYYIEVKSRYNEKSSILMSKLQLEKASQNPERYALISVDVTKYKGLGNRYKLEEHEILQLVNVIDTIGVKIKPIIEETLIAEGNVLSPVKLTDYKGLINQQTIQQGSSLEVFIEKLILILTSTINLTN